MYNENRNIRVNEGFTLDKLATDFMIEYWFTKWEKVTEKEEQKKYGDIKNSNNTYIDFKFDCYSNRNIVIEETQLCGYGWLDELDVESWICWVKCATGELVMAKVKDIIEFKHSTLYKIRQENKAYTGTTYKNFSIDEIKQYVNGAKYTDLSTYSTWNNRPKEMKASKTSYSDEKLYRNKSFEELVNKNISRLAREYERITGTKTPEYSISFE